MKNITNLFIILPDSYNTLLFIFVITGNTNREMNESRNQSFDCYNTLKYLNGNSESPSFLWILSAKSFTWDLVLPIICLLGTLTNLTNVLLFYSYKSHFKHEI